jgi:hypothetical protein
VIKGKNTSLKVRKTGIDEPLKRIKYLDITEEEYIFINKLIENSDFDFWKCFYGEIDRTKVFGSKLTSKNRPCIFG